MTEVALALICRDGRCFLQRRAASNPVMPGLWEFPGGKVEALETPLDALRRELREEVGVVFEAATELPVIEGPVRLHPFLVEGPDRPRTDLAWGWFTPGEMAHLPIPPANGELIRWLATAR
ncbi:NUDIX domain-containing protein [Geothrix oryzisoli]|uniref:NUDIX domain-containing protein n=1 Tax=Geothrix oryzisoli TaxID=2922721 RepID=UPI001FAE6D01|nr:NUDIX domain-containing protein [Geothrix oryzisoli]